MILGARRVLLLVTVFAMLGAPQAVRADRREWFGLVGYQGGATRFRVPSGGRGESNAYAGALDLTAYYGLSNAVHLGGRFRFSSTSDVRFSGVDVTGLDGRRSSGDVFADHLGFGFGGVVLYRVHTKLGARLGLEPVVEIGGGVTLHDYRNGEHFPADGTFSVPLESRSEVVLYGSGALLLEYRWRNHWLASTGVTVQLERGGPTPWSVFVPVRVGFVW